MTKFTDYLLFSIAVLLLLALGWYLALTQMMMGLVTIVALLLLGFWGYGMGQRRQTGQVLAESEARYRALAENSPDIIMRFDRQYRHLYANAAVSEVSMPPADFIGKTHRQLGFTAEEIAYWEEKIQAVFETGRPLQQQFEFNGRNGPVVFDWRLVPELGADGAVQTVLSVSRDITALRDAEARHREALRQSEARYRLLFNEMFNGFALHEIICDPAGRPVDYRFLEVNPAFAHLTGLPAAELVGKTVLEVLPQIEPDWIERYGRVAQTGQPAHFESYTRDLDRYYEVTAYSPQAGQFAVIFADVTERKKAELALRQSEARLRTIFEESPVGIATVALQETGPLLEANEAFCRMLGYSKSEMTRLTLSDITHPEDIEADKTLSLRLIAGELHSYQLEKRFLTRDKHIIWGQLTSTLVRDEEGHPLYGLGIIENITERKQAEAEKEQLQAQLLQAQKMEAVGQLAGGIAHDFNNILTAIMGHAGMARALFAPGHPALQDLDDLQASAQRAAGLIRQLLTFARRQVGQPCVLNLNDLLVNLVPMLRRLIGEDIELETRLEPDLHPVRIDPHQFEQVVVNLIVNARDAMPGGGALTLKTANAGPGKNGGTACCPLEPTGEYAMLHVIDTGTGIPAGIKERIFEPFFTTKKVGQGTGLGLATCFGIVREHNGHIGVNSEPGQGAAFMIYLPRAEARPGSTAVSSQQAGTLPRGQETILLVEDELTLRKLAARVLHQQGYTVIEAANGEEALKLAKDGEEKVDLLVTDMVMPLLGGWELAKKLAARWPGLKVLFISGYPDHKDFQLDRQELGRGYLPKPFTASDLAGQVRRLLDEA